VYNTSFSLILLLVVGLCLGVFLSSMHMSVSMLVEFTHIYNLQMIETYIEIFYLNGVEYQATISIVDFVITSYEIELRSSMELQAAHFNSDPGVGEASELQSSHFNSRT